jgi:hypothetical protein
MDFDERDNFSGLEDDDPQEPYWFSKRY